MKKNFLYVLVCLLLLAGCATTNTNEATINHLSPVEENSTNETNSNHSLETPESPSPGLDGSQSDDEPSTAKPSDEQPSNTVQTEPDEYDYVLIFPSNRYPETALHIYNAIENGHSDVCTIDREGAEENRKQSLQGIDTRDGYDRDEWPMAMCEEGGFGASVAYIDASDNRGAGSWVGHQLSAYENGERILFIVEKPKLSFSTGKENTEVTDQNDDTHTELEAVYNNCAEAREAGVTPLFEGEPGYSKKLDRDGDGIACEA